MKKKRYGIGMVLVMAAALFWGTLVSDNRSTYDATVVTEYLENHAMKPSEMIEAQAEVLKPEEPETKLSVSEAEKLSAHYGSYRITKFFHTRHYIRGGGEYIRRQEADMMLGRVIDIKQEELITYDTERRFGTRDGRYWFHNPLIERYRIENPQYGWQDTDNLEEESIIDYLTLKYFEEVNKDLYEQITGIISIPLFCEPFGTQEFYAMEDNSKLILYSHFSFQYFLLERCEEEAEESHPEWSSQEIDELMQGVYGEYQITKFLPTKYFPILAYGSKSFSEEEASQLLGRTVSISDLLSYDGYDKLSYEEADSMIGKNVTISPEMFVTYDNGLYDEWTVTYDEYLARSEPRETRKYPIEEQVIGRPEYRVKDVWADEIYGIQDGMLTEDLTQKEYVEIDVYPGYDYKLPQMYLVNDGRILLYAMGEYFLLEKSDGQNDAQSGYDLSDWVGKYIYLSEFKKYVMEIRKKTPGEYEADIEITVLGRKATTKLKADVYPSNEKIEFVFRECLTGEQRWEKRGGNVLLELARDTKTGDIYTYWEELNGNAGDKASSQNIGEICFEKEDTGEALYEE